MADNVRFGEIPLGYDVVVVGTGPAGCMAAYFLDDAARVLVIDEKNIPRYKPCGGVLVGESQKFLQQLLVPESVYTTPKRLGIIYQYWSNNQGNYLKKGFINIDRKKFDEWLFSLLSEKKNIDVCNKTKLVDFNKTNDGKYLVLILESNGVMKSIITKYLVGADGALSKIRQKLFTTKTKYYLAMQEKIKNNFGLSEAHFIYDDEITDFYSWIIPKNDSLIIGSALSPCEAREKFQLLKTKIKNRMMIWGKGIAEYAIILRPEKNEFTLGAGNVLLAGEAAGLISPSSAEGISFALESGKNCAKTLNSCRKNPYGEYKKRCMPLLKRLKTKFRKYSRKEKFSKKN